MTTISIDQILARCDELTRNGATLSIKWSGGNDSGWYAVYINGTMTSADPILNALLEKVPAATGYYGFDGPFDTEGEIVFNRETRSFEGEDCTTDSVVLKRACNIEILIPETLWFDRLDIELLDEYGRFYEPTSDLWIANGPKTSGHKDHEAFLNKILQTKFKEEIECLENYNSFDFRESIPRSDFKIDDGYYKYTITSFYYSGDETNYQEIRIDLNDL